MFSVSQVSQVLPESVEFWSADVLWQTCSSVSLSGGNIEKIVCNSWCSSVVRCFMILLWFMSTVYSQVTGVRGSPVKMTSFRLRKIVDSKPGISNCFKQFSLNILHHDLIIWIRSEAGYQRKVGKEDFLFPFTTVKRAILIDNFNLHIWARRFNWRKTRLTLDISWHVSFVCCLLSSKTPVFHSFLMIQISQSICLVFSRTLQKEAPEIVEVLPHNSHPSTGEKRWLSWKIHQIHLPLCWYFWKFCKKLRRRSEYLMMQAIRSGGETTSEYHDPSCPYDT